MKVLIEWLGANSNQFNEIALNLTAKDLTSTWLLFSVLITLALWFFWTSLNRIHSAFHKILLISLRALIFLFLLFVLLKPELEFKNS
ncbi:MAG: glutamine amidotransferase, partial [Nitrospinaceae bacterium]